MRHSRPEATPCRRPTVEPATGLEQMHCQHMTSTGADTRNTWEIPSGAASRLAAPRDPGTPLNSDPAKVCRYVCLFFIGLIDRSRIALVNTRAQTIVQGAQLEWVCKDNRVATPAPITRVC